MKKFNYHKRKACHDCYLGVSTHCLWVDFALKHCQWSDEDWKNVRFSDEVHFEQETHCIQNIIQKPEEVNDLSCIQYDHEPADPEQSQKCFHCWAMIEWNYKGSLMFYEVSGNTNNKMTMSVYINILEQHVLPLLERGDIFILEEDGDSGHGRANNNNIVRQWKQHHGLQYYFNAPQSPDLAPIENCWQPTKGYIDREDHLSDEVLKAWIIESWNQLPMSFINRQILTMHDRMKAVITGRGKRTAY